MDRTRPRHLRLRSDRIRRSFRVWNFDFRKAAGSRSVNRRPDTFKMKFDVRPLLVAQHNNRNPTPGKVLLITDVLIRRQKQFVTRFFGPLQQFTIPELMPANLAGIGYFMTS